MVSMRVLLVLLLAASSAHADERLGSIRFANSGKPEAQAAFLRGVAALHSFWYEEAADAFRDAETIDPDFALAYWGEAMTFNHPIWQEVDVEGGRKALAKWPHKATTDREVAWLDAIDKLYAGGGTKSAHDAAYEEAMGRVAAQYPDDDEAQIFHALAILGTMKRDEPTARKQIRAAAILEPLLAAHPDHPGVLHYLIHAYDDPLHAPLGLRAALRYAKVAPAAFHALHMPSHIFLQLGMWPEAASSNEQSYAASKAWVERKHLGGSKRDLHSLVWLQYIYLQQHRFDDAKKLLDEVKATKDDSDRERATRVRMEARYAIETGDWSVLSAAPASGSETPHAGCKVPAAYADAPNLRHYAAGLQAVAQHRLDDARAEAAALAAARSKAEKDEDKRTLEAMQREIEGAAKIAAGQTADGLAVLSSAVQIEETLGAPSGPPEVMKPAREMYGEALLAAGRTQEALEQFRASLLRTPNRALSVEGERKAGGLVAPRPAERGEGGRRPGEGRITGSPSSALRAPSPR